ncbi:MAG: T9SS type A sorting domain-containing protein [Bacteroidota bacterium]|nr:T9SS type A sorting domain-containing protein [Bacteroidota bacterium]
MKKLLPAVLIMFSISFMLTAQNFTIEDHNGVDVSNTTIDINGSVSDNELAVDMKVVNNGAADYDVILKKSYISIVANTSNHFCTSVCFPSGTMESGPYLVNAGQSNDISFHYFPSGNAGSSTIMYTIYNADVANHPGDSVSVTVNYIVTNNVDEAFSTRIEIYPNPATDIVKFDYQINSANNSWFTFYNMLGNKVKSINLDKSFGNLIIPVDDLEAGIYFYSVIVNGDAIKTNRLVINR